MGDRTQELELVARAAAGDGDAFGELVRPLEDKVYALAYRMCGDREDAYDLAQEALLKAYRALPRFGGRSSFATWLYRIVANTCLDRLRALRRAGPVVSLDNPLPTRSGELHREAADPTYDPERLTLAAEAEAEVQRALGRLSPDHRLVILLRDYEDRSYEEIAEIMGCSLGTVKSRLNRARAALRARLVQGELPSRPGVYSVGRRGVDA
ncbi:MAG: sigma-70 family RNA polymerase sigma factor [Firmicutes bacterium]|nr:sigma-70 family RNA polymerase sigma factor [Bacillota bacterium]